MTHYTDARHTALDTSDKFSYRGYRDDLERVQIFSRKLKLGEIVGFTELSRCA